MNPANNGGHMLPMNSNFFQMVQQFKQWKQTFNGDPKKTVMDMVQAGKLSQEQLNTAQQIAQQIQGLMQ